MVETMQGVTLQIIVKIFLNKMKLRIFFDHYIYFKIFTYTITIYLTNYYT